MVIADKVRCRNVGELIKGLNVKDTFYTRPFIHNKFSIENRLSLIFNAVVICHQTHNLHHAGLNVYGWDYIEHAFLKLAETGSPLLNPLLVAELETEEIKLQLLRLFSETGNAEDSTLDRIEERTHLFKEFNLLIVNKFSGRFENLLTESNNLLFNNSKGFYELISQSVAYSDARYKKSSFLLKLLFDSGLYHVKDEQNFFPIVDYHMQRVLLRTGCIEIKDKEYDHKILNRIKVSTDEPVREASIEAFRIMAEVSGKKLWIMNDIFWPLGRSCCNEITLCTDHKCSKNPCTFDLMIDSPDHTKCILMGLCKGYLSGRAKAYHEPNVTTHYY